LPFKSEKKAFVRALHHEDENSYVFARNGYSLLSASPSYDMWSVGVIFFELCTREPLFLCDEEDNIDDDALVSLAQWSNEVKSKKLSKVFDPHARHLLSQLLQKDPSRRPSARRVLAHPFLTGKITQRLHGETAEYDAFISYRVASDFDHAARLYHLLTARGLKVSFIFLLLYYTDFIIL
jgi:serine/threonine protein kinase